MRTVRLTEQVPEPGSDGRTGSVLIGLLVLADAGLLVSALVPAAWVFAGLAVALVGLEVGVLRKAPFGSWAFGRLAGGAPFRGLVQGIGLLVLLARAGRTGWIVGAGIALLAVHLARLAGSGLAEYVRRTRKMPVLVRGLPLPGVRIPPAPPRWLTAHATEVLSWPGYALVIGGALSAATGTLGLLVTGAAVAIGLVLAGDAVLAAGVLAARSLSRARFVAAVEAAIAELGPRIALYHAGDAATGYQAEQWLAPLERVADRLRAPAVVILRDREAFGRFGPTALPVICVEPSTVLMALELPELRLALYAAHAAGNPVLLRRHGVTHAFVGHGDSDKPVTVNPYVGAYGQIWVAGPAARERFAAAELPIGPERVVEVGRPQLAALEPRATREPGKRLTVLYAPTWEGFDDEPDQTSVGPLGLEIIRRLVAEPDVRVLYRPHPLQGSRHPAVRRAHREILGLLGLPADAGPADVGPADAGGAGPARRSRPRRTPDELELAVARPGPSRLESDAADRARTHERLAATPGHLEVPGPAYDLNACLEAADVLVADVSSVITEFLATGRPYAVTDPGDRGTTERAGTDHPPGGSGPGFAVRYPSSRGGYRVDMTGDGLAAVLRAGRGDGDPAAAARADLAARLLGTIDAATDTRFVEAVERAIDRKPAG